MDKILLREIIKVTLWFVSPLLVVYLLFLNGQLELVIAFIIGVILGVLRLKALFRYVICTIDKENPIGSKISLVKYLGNLFFILGAIGFVLIKTETIGLAILIGLLSVPIIVMFYSFIKGISYFVKK